MKLYLASGSPRRREILDLMHLPYEICTALSLIHISEPTRP